MPIFLRRATNTIDQNHRSLLRIVQDLSAENRLHEVVSQWHAIPEQYELWLAVFNDRNVGFALMQGNEIKGLAVHGATRKRGIGRRILTLLKQNYPSLTASAEIPDQIVSRLIGELK